MKHLTLIDKAFLLKKTKIFSRLDLDLLLVIADKLESVEFEANDYIFAPEETGGRMYFILRGQILIQDEEKKELATLESPEFFGDEALLSDQPRAYFAKAKTDCLLLTLSKTNLLTIISECPQVAMSLLQAYTSQHKFRPRRES